VHTDLLDILAGQGLDPEAAQRLVDALPAAGGANIPPKPETPVLGRPCATPRRDKVFGPGRGRPLDRNTQARIMHRGHAMRRQRILTRADVDVLRSLLFDFFNRADGRCFPSYQTIAKAAACAASTVGEAIKRLEAAGLLTWENRLARIRERCAGLLGPLSAWRTRVIRTSNAYRFAGPASETDFRGGTRNPDSNLLAKTLFDRRKRESERLSAHALGGA
jgi:Helix-turn-helix domain